MLKERYNEESITMDALEQLVQELSKDYEMHQPQLTEKMLKIKQEYEMKINYKEDLTKSKHSRLKKL